MTRTPKTMNNSKVKKTKRIGLTKSQDGAQSYISPKTLSYLSSKTLSEKGAGYLPKNISGEKRKAVIKAAGRSRADHFSAGSKSRAHASVVLSKKLNKKPVGGK